MSLRLDGFASVKLAADLVQDFEQYCVSGLDARCQKDTPHIAQARVVRRCFDNPAHFEEQNLGFTDRNVSYGSRQYSQVRVIT